MTQLNLLPDDLPVPEDDGACNHLQNLPLPSMELPTTDGNTVNFATLSSVVIYLYPMTGQPDLELPNGWDQIAGARGCTPQSCAFRDPYAELHQLGSRGFGLSTPPTAYQKEAKSRLHLPFELVSDEALTFIKVLSIPRLYVDDMILAKRVTQIAQQGIIKKVFYPVFPSDKNADQVIEYLKTQH